MARWRDVANGVGMALVSVVLATGLVPGMASADSSGGALGVGSATIAGEAQAPAGSQSTRITTTAVAYKISQAKVSVAKSAKYTGRAVKPKVTVKLAGKTLEAGKGYTVAYRNAKGKKVSAPKAAGTYKVIVTGKGNLVGSVTRKFKVVKTTSAKKLNAKAIKAYRSFLTGSKAAYGDGVATPTKGKVGDFDVNMFSAVDLNKDGVKELVTLGTSGMARSKVFVYKNGKVKQVIRTTGITPYSNGVVDRVFQSGFGYETHTYCKLTNAGKVKDLYQYSAWWNAGGTVYREGTKSYDETTPTTAKATIDKKVAKVVGKGKVRVLSAHPNTAQGRKDGLR